MVLALDNYRFTREGDRGKRLNDNLGRETRWLAGGLRVAVAKGNNSMVHTHVPY